MRKKARSYKFSLIILLLLSFLLVIFLLMANNKRKQNQHNRIRQINQAVIYNKSHFNPCVKIYGVDVSKLTIDQAYRKVNKKAVNALMIDGRDIKLIRKDFETITRKQVEDYFNKQKTRLPNYQKYIFRNKELLDLKGKAENIVDAKVVFEILGKKYIFSRKKYYPKVECYNKAFYFLDDSLLKARIERLNQEYSTLHKKYHFETPEHGMILVRNESYGWAINSKQLIEAIKSAYINKHSGLKGHNFVYGIGYSSYGKGYGKGNNGLGNTYIAVSIPNQEAWFYKHGKLVLKINNIVTGTAANKLDATPKGVWYIHYKQSPSVLRGKNSDGTPYASRVRYWMPFTLSGCGLHDAAWRTDWSKTAYIKNGSHGCVNIKPSLIKAVWNVVEKDEPVVIY